ncbi:MAG: sugar phosphate isomerase/epimerase [Lentisphaerae bacterium]|nr:sugar phosphate isomerase/epimerase [Lentisphaerota bacterium]
MKPAPISIQLYSVREEAARDFPGTLKKIADIGYAGVEFAGFHGMKPAEVKKIVDKLGLKVSSSHMAMPTAENAKELIETAKTLGFTDIVAGLAPDDFATLEKTQASIATFKKAAAALKGTGFRLGAHNHWWEFDKKFDGKYPHDLLMAAVPELTAELDTYWIATGGADPAEVVKRVGKRAPLLHIKDGPCNKNEAMTAVGKGKVRWDLVLEAAVPTVEWLIVELDRCDTDMMEAVADSYRFLVKSGYGRGRK